MNIDDIQGSRSKIRHAARSAAYMRSESFNAPSTKMEYSSFDYRDVTKPKP